MRLTLAAVWFPWRLAGALVNVVAAFDRIVAGRTNGRRSRGARWRPFESLRLRSVAEWPGPGATIWPLRYLAAESPGDCARIMHMRPCQPQMAHDSLGATRRPVTSAFRLKRIRRHVAAAVGGDALHFIHHHRRWHRPSLNQLEVRSRLEAKFAGPNVGDRRADDRQAAAMASLHVGLGSDSTAILAPMLFETKMINSPRFVSSSGK